MLNLLTALAQAKKGLVGEVFTVRKLNILQEGTVVAQGLKPRSCQLQALPEHDFLQLGCVAR